MGYGRELEEFENAVLRLKNAVYHASALWQDGNYAQLSQSVALVGNQSKIVAEAGRRSEHAVALFEEIANENY